MQEGTGSGDITQKVGEGDGSEREREREQEWEYSVCLSVYMAWYLLCVHNMDGCVGGWMDGQWTLQLMRGSDCYSRFVSCSQTQGATRMRTAEAPSQGCRRRGWRWWWWYSQSARRPGKEKKKNAAARRGGCFGALRQQKAWVKAGAGRRCRRKCGSRSRSRSRSKSRRVGSAVRQYVRTVPYLPCSLTAVCAPPPSLGTVDR